MGFNYEQYEEVLEGTNDVTENEELMNFIGDEYDYAGGIKDEVKATPTVVRDPVRFTNGIRDMQQVERETTIVKKEIFTKKNIAMGLGLVAIIGAVIYFNKK